MTRLEFLLGKQLPYVAVAMLSFVVLVALAVTLFGVALKGSLSALAAGALLSRHDDRVRPRDIRVHRTQIAALFGTAIATMTLATQFSGVTNPVSSLEGAGRAIGNAFPTTYFLTISRGIHQSAGLPASGEPVPRPGRLHPCGDGLEPAPAPQARPVRRM